MVLLICISKIKYQQFHMVWPKIEKQCPIWIMIKLSIAEEWFLTVIFSEIPGKYYNTRKNAKELCEQMQLS